jgi:enterochelin esterase-like enzyme
MPKTRPDGRAEGDGPESPEGAQAPKIPKAPRASKPESTKAEVLLAAAGAAGEAASDRSRPAREGRLRRGFGQVAAAARQGASFMIAVAAAAAVLAGAVALGPVAGSNALLVGLGFDPDRAQLITALIVGGTAAAVAYLCGGVRRTAVALGLAAILAVFGPTFLRETRDAMAATGALGSFDPSGWTITALALLAVGALISWATVVCFVPVRRELDISARATLVAARRRPFDRRLWTRPVATLLVMSLLAITVPVAGELFNYGADTRMIAGGPPRMGLAPQDQALPSDDGTSFEPPSATPSETPTGSPIAAGSPGATPSSTPTPTSVPTDLPWKASAPAGKSKMLYLAFNAPWVNAGSDTVEVAVYFPPGYDGSGDKRYPAVYEAPFTFNLWNGAFHIQPMLDQLITAGTIPPSLFVFISTGAGPYGDPECSNTYDGREKMDTFMGDTVPTWIDRHYRTIAKPAARATLGMSEGGYCAAILALHHPDVFASAISFSGYFTAGAAGAATKIPFGGNQKLIDNDSPTYVAPRLAASVKPNLYFVIVANRTQEFYGSEATGFAKILDDAGIKNSFIDSDSPHGWPQVRNNLEQVLVLLATQQAAWGVFD